MTTNFEDFLPSKNISLAICIFTTAVQILIYICFSPRKPKSRNRKEQTKSRFIFLICTFCVCVWSGRRCRTQTQIKQKQKTLMFSSFFCFRVFATVSHRPTESEPELNQNKTDINKKPGENLAW